jgi:uncharacterized membrane protein
MTRARLLIPIAVFALALLVVSIAAAQTGGNYDLSWSTIDNGGGSSSGSSYTLEGTLGQPDTGASSGGSYTLYGGFWGGGSVAYAESHPVYLPIIIR